MGRTGLSLTGASLHFTSLNRSNVPVWVMLYSSLSGFYRAQSPFKESLRCVDVLAVHRTHRRTPGQDSTLFQLLPSGGHNNEWLGKREAARRHFGWNECCIST